MSLPTKWVDAIFTKLGLAYGRDFLGRWEGLPISAVKTDWSECLKGFVDHPESIAFALSNLPDSRPPTAQEFRALCRQAPLYAKQALPAPKADDSLVTEQLRKMSASAFKAPKDSRGNVDHKLWAKRLNERHQNGEKLNLIQVNAYRKALDIRDVA